MKQWEIGPADGRECPIRGPAVDNDPGGHAHRDNGGQGGTLDLNWELRRIILNFP